MRNRRHIKNILVVLQSDYPPHMRVYREMVSLQAVGYNVSLLCDNRERKLLLSNEEGVNVFRMPYLGKFHCVLNAPFFPNPTWLAMIYFVAKKIKADVIHVHDLPLALSSIQIGRALGLPVIYDMHENYPAAMEGWYKPGLAGWTIRNPRIARFVEKYCLNHADKIIVVADEHKQLLTSMGVFTKKIHVVENTPLRKLLNYHSKSSSRINNYSKNYLLTYFGKINPERNLELVLHAFPEIRAIIPNARFLVIGDGPHLKKIKEEVSKLDLNDWIDFKGWLRLEEAVPLFEETDICIMPHDSNDHLDYGIPNKLFEYMSFGKPVVIGDSRASARIVREAGCGEIFKPGSIESFVEAVLKIKGSTESYGENGRMLIKQKYHWENTSKKLLQVYDEIER